MELAVSYVTDPLLSGSYFELRNNTTLPIAESFSCDEHFILNIGIYAKDICNITDRLLIKPDYYKFHTGGALLEMQCATDTLFDYDYTMPNNKLPIFFHYYTGLFDDLTTKKLFYKKYVPLFKNFNFSIIADMFKISDDLSDILTIKDSTHYTALMYAGVYNLTNFFTDYLIHDYIEHSNRSLNYTLMEALHKNNLSIINYCIKKLKDDNLTISRTGMCAFKFACKTKNIPLIELLLTTCGAKCYWPITAANKKHFTKSIKLNPEFCGADTPLLYAIKHDDSRYIIMHFIIACHYNITKILTYSDVRAAVIHSITTDDVELFKRLLTVAPSFFTGKNDLCLYLCKFKHVKFAKILINEFRKLCCTWYHSIDWNTPLIYSCNETMCEIAYLLIDKFGLDCVPGIITITYNNTALLTAVGNKLYDLAKYIYYRYGAECAPILYNKLGTAIEICSNGIIQRKI